MANRKETKKAYQIVLENLKQTPLFCGKYDALNGSEDFMDGIRTVMEVIAFNAGEYDKFDKEFSKNLLDSLVKSGIIESERGGK
jgi:hypothetical protein